MISIAIVTAMAPSLLGAGGFSAFTYLMYRQLPAPYYKNKLKKLFIAGGIYRKVSKKSGVEGKTKEILILPDVKRVGTYEDYSQIIFAIPNGINPADVMSRLWLFKQGFGSNIELTGDHKTFNLEVYLKPMEQFEYSLDEIKAKLTDEYLPIVAGKTRKGYIIYDMVVHPHLLIAGETGSGKSVQLRSIISTLILLMNDRIELYLADLKMSEFHLFTGIAKKLDYNADDLTRTMLIMRKEMTKRGKLLRQYKVAHVIDLPKEVQPKFIVLAIDEVVILKKHKDLLTEIEAMTSLGRAYGMFVILSMQRPDAKLLDGALKNNLTVVMGFRHKDAINSRITLDSDHASHIGKSEKGRNYTALDTLYNVQAPYLDLKKAAMLLDPFRRKDELFVVGEDHIIELKDYEVLDDELEGTIEFGVFGDDDN